MAWSTEPGYDNVIVEAHVVGSEDWTTLPDANGGTTKDLPAECEAGFYIGLHPNLAAYLTLGDPCTPTAPGAWNAFTGDSGGWQPVRFDLSAYAGQQVEIVISYVTDPVTGGTGVIVDDTRLTTTAGVRTPRDSSWVSVRGRCWARPKAARATSAISSGDWASAAPRRPWTVTSVPGVGVLGIDDRE